MEATTVPLTLHPFTVTDAERLLAGEVDPTDGWEGGYAFTEEPELIAEYLGAVRESGDPAPFGPYLVRRGADGAAIGGVNLFATDDPRVVEFVFGLVPAARGEGLGTHTVVAVLALIRSVGAEVARAECEVANLSARRALSTAGMLESSRTGESVIYELRF
ncbi:GNAT family N-acetyltransferase [Agromyces intestinalis]|uniref:GNAT family N-acetyltransferase n=1 Tax=Agromyces intestinalis TaxID=2592652 RepID=UPI00143E09B1|nr:GNAT family N-acetyltransferase [Agromyces intestinalis]